MWQRPVGTDGHGGARLESLVAGAPCAAQAHDALISAALASGIEARRTA